MKLKIIMGAKAPYKEDTFMKTGISILIGAVVGAVVGIAATSKYFEKKYSDIANEEIESVKSKFYDAATRKKNITYKKKTSENDIENDNDTAEDQSKESIKITNDQSTEAAVEYYNRIKEYKTVHHMNNIENANDKDNVNVYGVPVKYDEGFPFIIDEDEYGNDSYDTDTLSYYITDDTLADSQNEIANINDLIGDCLEDESAYDKDVIYVRNPKLGMDFEVELIQNSYQEVVMGVYDNDSSKK